MAGEQRDDARDLAVVHQPLQAIVEALETFGGKPDGGGVHGGEIGLADRAGDIARGRNGARRGRFVQLAEENSADAERRGEYAHDDEGRQERASLIGLHGGPPVGGGLAYYACRLAILAQVSRRVTVRLKTGRPSFESGSTQK